MTTRIDDAPHEYRGVAITSYRPYFAHPRMPKANVRFIAKSETLVAWSDSWPKLKAHIDRRSELRRSASAIGVHKVDSLC